MFHRNIILGARPGSLSVKNPESIDFCEFRWERQLFVLAIVLCSLWQGRVLQLGLPFLRSTVYCFSLLFLRKSWSEVLTSVRGTLRTVVKHCSEFSVNQSPQGRHFSEELARTVSFFGLGIQGASGLRLKTHFSVGISADNQWMISPGCMGVFWLVACGCG